MREKVEGLERIVTQSRAPAQNKSSAQRPDRKATTNVVEKRFHVSIAMDTPQVFDAERKRRGPRALRKERRQGRIVFLILLASLRSRGHVARQPCPSLRPCHGRNFGSRCRLRREAGPN